MSNKLYIIGILVLVTFLGYNFFSTPPVTKSASAINTDLPKIINGKQVIKMSVASGGYIPNYFKIKSGVPVEWQITTTNNAGCASALVARPFFSEIMVLSPGSTVTKEFIPTTTGTYRFSCSMGMYTGTFEVI